MVWPWIPRAPSPHSISAACATSSGVIIRRCGLIAASWVRASSSLRPVLAAIRVTASSAIWVSTHPGHSALIVTPVRARSIASARVIPTIACLAAQYAVE